jgi:hypothetical protein
MTMEKKRTPNDQRSDVKNPTAVDSKNAANNKSNQMNPKSSSFNASKNKNKK